MPKLSKDFTLSNSVPLDKDAALGRWPVSNANVGADLPLGLWIRQELEITRSTFQAPHKKKQDLECSQNLSSGPLPVLPFAKRVCVMSGCVPPRCQLAQNGPWNVCPHMTEAKVSAHRNTTQQKVSVYQIKARSETFPADTTWEERCRSSGAVLVLYAEKSPTSCTSTTWGRLCGQSTGPRAKWTLQTVLLICTGCPRIATQHVIKNPDLSSGKIPSVVNWGSTEEMNSLWPKRPLLQDVEVTKDLQSRSLKSGTRDDFAKLRWQERCGGAGSRPCPWCSLPNPGQRLTGSRAGQLHFWPQRQPAELVSAPERQQHELESITSKSKFISEKYPEL